MAKKVEFPSDQEMIEYIRDNHLTLYNYVPTSNGYLLFYNER